MSREYITTEAGLIRARAHLDEYLVQTKNPKLALDCETEHLFKGPDEVPRPIRRRDGSLSGAAALLQLGADPDIYNYQWLFNVKKLGSDLITKYLKEPIERGIILGHNLKYDVAFLIAQFGICPQIFRCTMLLSQIVNAGDKYFHSLGGCYEKFLDWHWFQAETGMSFAQYEAFKKTMQISDWGGDLSEDQLRYASDDVRLIFPLYRSMLEVLKEKERRYGCSGIYDIIKLECGLIPEYALMELRGIDFDSTYHRTHVIDHLTVSSEEAKNVCGQRLRVSREKTSGRGVKKITQVIEQPALITSPKQVTEALASIGLVVSDTQEKTLKEQLHILELDDPRRESLGALVRAKKASSLLSKFGQKMLDLVHDDGRIHPHFFQIGSDMNGISTGRSSAKDPNIMQMPSKGFLYGNKDVPIKDFFRRAFTVTIGYKLLDSDFSQIEPRCTAQITKDKALIEEFNNKTRKADLHALTAMRLLDLPEPPKKGTYERDTIGKIANLAMSYGIGPKKLAKFMFDETLDSEAPIQWTMDECKANQDVYYNLYAGIKRAMEDVQRKLLRKMEAFESLAYFKNRRPIFHEETEGGRIREWYLTGIQESLAKNDPEKLRKDYIVWVDEVVEVVEDCQEPIFDSYGMITGWETVPRTVKKTIRKQSNWNEYNKTLNRIAREAYNFKIQGSCADIMKIAVLNTGQQLASLGIDVLNEGIIAVIHDEILIRIRIELIDKAKEIVHNCMVEAGQKYIKLVPIEVEPQEALTWADCH